MHNANLQYESLTWTTLTTKKSETGKEKITNKRDPRAMAFANIPGPSSQAKSEIFKLIN